MWALLFSFLNDPGEPANPPLAASAVETRRRRE
jgi:hypothetical protein